MKPLRIFLGTAGCATLGYTGFVGYVQIRTKHEIAERTRIAYEKGEHNGRISSPLDLAKERFGSMVVGGHYVNPFVEYRSQTLFEFVYCRIIELFHREPRGSVPLDPQAILRMLPRTKPDYSLLHETVQAWSDTQRSFWKALQSIAHPRTYLANRSLPDINERMTLTWMGQSCAFVQLPGMNILTDPCLGEHLVSEYVGPKRISPAPCDLDELPSPDLVLVSHDHPDHFELDVVKKIGNSALWIVPAGVGSHLQKLGVTNFRELDWWQKTSLDGVGIKTSSAHWEVACTPAMHWSGRKLIDSNDTLWGSFLFLRDNKPIFFHGGDTGYSADLFTTIGKVYGPGCQVAMLPCGAYTPRWHLRPQHIDPHEAVQVMQDIGSQKMVGVHWGTFVLSDEHFLEPRELLHKIARNMNLSNNIIAPEFGKTLVFPLTMDRAKNKSSRVRDSLLLE